MTVITSNGFVVFPVKESGDSLKDIYNDEVLLLCNHQSTADIGVMMQSMYSKGPTAGHLIWIMDHVFRLTHFGWMSCFHGDFFLEKPRVVLFQFSRNNVKKEKEKANDILTTLY